MAPAPTGSRRREVARTRALSLARRAAEMRQAAAAADLANRRRVLLEAATRFRRLAEQQLAIARGG